MTIMLFSQITCVINIIAFAYIYVCHNFHVYEIGYIANKICMELYSVAYRCRFQVQMCDLTAMKTRYCIF